jgi:uncharacterized protein HemY
MRQVLPIFVVLSVGVVLAFILAMDARDKTAKLESMVVEQSNVIVAIVQALKPQKEK